MTVVRTDADRVLREHEQQEEEKRHQEAQAQAQKNIGFVQVDEINMDALALLAFKVPASVGLLLMMAKRMSRTNALVASQQALMEITGMSRSSLYRAIKELQDRRYIDVVKIGSASAYVVNSNVFWKSHGDKKHTVFNATVIATSSEQEVLDPSRNVTLRRFPVLAMRKNAKKDVETIVKKPKNTKKKTSTQGGSSVTTEERGTGNA